MSALILLTSAAQVRTGAAAPGSPREIVLPNVEPVIGMENFHKTESEHKNAPSGLSEDNGVTTADKPDNTGTAEERAQEEADKAETDPVHQRFVGETEVLPITGFAPPAYAELDRKVCDVLRKYDIPGASVCIAIKGKIIVSRGYGYADVHKRQPVQPDTLFRIASVSKALTSVAIAKLIAEHKIGLNDKVFALLKYPWEKGVKRDPRLSDITVKHLLEMTGGWNRDRSGDPLFTPFCKDAAEKFTPTLRPTPESIVRFWLERPLDFEPGTRFAYSNFGYTLLGELIQRVTGRDYEEYIKKEILAPTGVTEMRTGKTFDMAPKETVHYPFVGQETALSIFPNFKGEVPLNYGANFSLEAMRADTGWIASSVDLVKFMSALCGESAQSPISKNSWEELLEWDTNLPQWKNPRVKVFFAKGWQVVPDNPFHKRVVYREGCLAGSVSVLMHRDDGVSWAFCLNSRPVTYRHSQLDVSNAIWSAVNKQLGIKVKRPPEKPKDPFADFDKLKNQKKEPPSVDHRPGQPKLKR